MRSVKEPEGFLGHDEAAKCASVTSSWGPAGTASKNSSSSKMLGKLAGSWGAIARRSAG